MRPKTQIWLHKPTIGEALNQLARALYTDSLLSVREQELARMRVVVVNGCHF